MPPPNNNPLTDDDRATILRLHADGMPRNEIARQTGRGVATVTRTVQAAGGSFDRAAQTEIGVKARQADNRKKRAELEAGILDDALKLRLQMFAPVEYIDHGGKDFIEVRWEQNRPTVRDQKDIAIAVGSLTDRAVKLALHDSDAGTETAKSMIGALFAGLAAAVHATDDQPDAEPAG